MVDFFAPDHDRMSCCDDDVSNGDHGEDGYDERTGKKLFYHPRCVRCYLLDNVGNSLPELAYKLTVHLERKGPKLRHCQNCRNRKTCQTPVFKVEPGLPCFEE
jgi:hypothetical protein